MTSEAKGLVPLAQPVLVAGHQGAVALAGDSGVTCCKELYFGQVFTILSDQKKGVNAARMFLTNHSNMSSKIVLVAPY
jgi:hypothetical protein